jgi:energy-coupling factor transport system substrate-specific component
MMGARLSLHPMTDDFVPVILSAVDGLDQLGLKVEVDDVSTCLLGTEPAVFEGVRVAFGRAAARGAHVVASATFSAGCPGEPDGDICVPRAEPDTSGGQEGWSAEAYDLPDRIAAQFALYPLGRPDYMDTIYAQIQGVADAGLRVVGRHFCTHLYGPGQDVFDVLRMAFASARTAADHVVMTVTASANSPSPEESA